MYLILFANVWQPALNLHDFLPLESKRIIQNPVLFFLRRVEPLFRNVGYIFMSDKCVIFLWAAFYAPHINMPRRIPDNLTRLMWDWIDLHPHREWTDGHYIISALDNGLFLPLIGGGAQTRNITYLLMWPQKNIAWVGYRKAKLLVGW